MGKESAPAAPDYTPIAQADEQQANQEYQLGEQQLQFGQQEYNQIEPYEQQFLQQQTASSAAETANASSAQQFYDQTYQPIQTSFANQALNYNTPGSAAQYAGNAEADVATAFDQQRAASAASLESYGIDPSQTRYQALDLGTRISQAAATSAAGTQSYLNTQATGLNLENAAIAQGQGIQANALNLYGGASSSGSSGIGSYNQTTGATANSEGTPGTFLSAGNQSSSNAVSALNTGYSNSLAGSEFEAQQSAGFSSGIGQLAGTAAMAAAIAF